MISWTSTIEFRALVLCKWLSPWLRLTVNLCSRLFVRKIWLSKTERCRDFGFLLRSSIFPQTPLALLHHPSPNLQPCICLRAASPWRIIRSTHRGRWREGGERGGREKRGQCCGHWPLRLRVGVWKGPRLRAVSQGPLIKQEAELKAPEGVSQTHSKTHTYRETRNKASAFTPATSNGSLHIG